MTTAWGQILPEKKSDGDRFYYLLAVMLGALAGWVNIKVGDLLLTAMVVLAACMLLGILSPRKPWRWVLLVGVFVPVLPPFYTTVWFGGLPYYYSNQTYYVYGGPQGYEVVQPPGDPGSAVQGPQGPAYPGAPPPAPGDAHPEGEDIYVYPQHGQSPDQQANDRYDCHKWASSQTGFDPTQAGGGVAPDQTVARGEEYRRAIRACLEGRGYSVR